ncbi:DNA-deoxyinosine glycosylase [Burkholderiaceae bacterium UC74_6]
MDANAWALVLGSFPGRASLAASQYYGHPQNQFWRLLGAVLEISLVGQPYERRLSLMRVNGVGLWDVITSTEREGSLDSAIRNHEASDLHRLLDSLPGLRVIGFNGGTAARIGRKQLGERASSYRLLDLPSSSPAYTLNFDAKLAQWMQLRDEQENSN